MAHHALMFSTPVGVLNWRLNQLIARDIGYVFQKCFDFRIPFPKLRAPITILEDEKWQMDFFCRNDGIPPGDKAYLCRVINAIQQQLRLRKILFEANTATLFQDLNFGQLLTLLNWFSEYATERCEVPFPRWKTKLPLATLVFSAGKSFNVVDIAECHAIAEELFVLRALHDSDELHARLERASSGPHGQAIRAAILSMQGVPGDGESPYRIQVAALLACCTSLDRVADDQTTKYLEDELPWWRIGSPELFSPTSIKASLENLLTLSNQPLFTAGSNWLDYGAYGIGRGGGAADSDGVPANLDDISDFLKAHTSFGLDVQAYSIHRSAALNLRFLTTLLMEGSQFEGSLPFEPAGFDEWREQFIAVGIIEYADEIHFRGIDVNASFGADHPLRKHPAFDRLTTYEGQLFANIMVGAQARCMYAAYSGKAIPSARILEPKLAKCLGNFRFGTDVAKLLELVFDRGVGLGIPQKHLRILGPDAGWNRYI